MINKIRRKRRQQTYQHPVFNSGRMLPPHVIYVTTFGACDFCHEEVDLSMPCPYCMDD